MGAVTATPAHNKVTDWEGYTRLMWYTSDIKSLIVPAAFEDEEIENLDPQYGKDDERRITADSSEDNEAVGVLEFIHKEMGYKWWMLHPAVQARVQDQKKIDAKSKNILQATKVFVLNRGMNTRLTLPNGQVVFPQGDMPPSRLHHVLLGYCARGEEIKGITDSMLKNISTILPDDPQDNLDEVNMGSARNSKENKKAALNHTHLRGMTYAAVDYHSFEMMFVEDEVTEMSASDFDKAVEKEGILKPGFHVSGRAEARERLKTKKGEETKLGATLTDRLRVNASDGGLAWQYSMVHANRRDLFPPSDRVAMVWFWAAESPFHAFVLKKCLEAKERKKPTRVLVMHNYPWGQL